jgi:hypothetical protein
MKKKLSKNAAAFLTLPVVALTGLLVFQANAAQSNADITIGDGSLMQLVNIDNCPTERTFVRDARDNKTYWIQKIEGAGADGSDLCWMQTNLAYGGGISNNGNNDFDDVMLTLTQDIESGNAFPQFNPATPPLPGFFIDTVYPDAPSLGIGSNAGPLPIGAQYGFLYNWCAAMGGQDEACTIGLITEVNTDLSVCPAGWRLPSVGDFTGLNDAVNQGRSDTDEGLITYWLNVYALPSWGAGDTRGGVYWTTDFDSTEDAHVWLASADESIAEPGFSRNAGYSVRCVNDTLAPISEPENPETPPTTPDPNVPEVPDTGFFAGVLGKIRSMPIIATLTIAAIVAASTVFGIKTARRTDKISKMKK